MTVTNETTTDEPAARSATTKTAFTAPILPGMADAHRQGMAAAENGEAADAHSASRRRAGISKEQVWHQDTPDGSIAIVYIEAADMAAAFESLATSDDPYDREFRGHVAAIHGIDLTEDFELPELLLDFSAGGEVGEQPQRMAFAAPILPGKEVEDREYHASVTTGDRADEFQESRRRAGITREVTWHQSTPVGPIAVGFMESEDVAAAMETLATSDEPFDRYFRDTVGSVHGIDFTEGFPPPEQILDWSA